MRLICLSSPREYQRAEHYTPSCILTEKGGGRGHGHEGVESLACPIGSLQVEFTVSVSSVNK